MIRYDRIEDFRVPLAFVYVCSATKSAPVNITPIYHLGRKSVKKMVILCGAKDPDNPQGNEETEAVRPTRWLEGFARDTLELTEDDIEVVPGNADDFGSWERVASQAVRMAEEGGNLAILANVQGGTKQMSHAIDHHLTIAGANWMRVVVGKRPALTSIIVPVGTSLLQYWHEDVCEQPSFELLLSAANVNLGSEHDQNLANRKREYYQTWTHKSKVLFEALCHEDGWEALRGLNSANSAHNNSKTDLKLACYADAMAKGSSRFRGHGELAVEHCKRIYSAALGEGFWKAGDLGRGVRQAFLTGGWLEQYIFEWVRAAVQHKPHMVARALVPLRLHGRMDEALEIDVLLQHDAVFHLIEAKSGTTDTGLFDRAKKLSALSRAIAGRPSALWIVAPFMRFDSETKQEAAIERCKYLWQVTLLTGPNAVARLIEDITNLDG